MKRNIFLILLISIVSYSQGQRVYLGMQTGMGRYKMEELKYFTSSTSKSNPLEPYLIDEYPPFIYFQPYLSVQWELIELGLFYSFHSTGSRYAVEDNSGEYLFDTRIRSVGPGILLNLRLIAAKGFHFTWYNEIGFLKTKMIMEESLELGDREYYDESYNFVGTDAYWEPGIKVEYPLAIFLFEFNFGYALQFDGKGLEYQGANYKAFLQVSGKNVHAGWNGVRLGLSAAISITGLKHWGKE